MSSAVFLDRDGVINENRADYILHPDEVEFVPRVLRGLALLAAAHLPCYVVTNQAAVGRGLLSEAGLAAIHERIAAEAQKAGARLAGFYHCPHRADERCRCRKPRIGLFEQAAAEHGITLERSYYIGGGLYHDPGKHRARTQPDTRRRSAPFARVLRGAESGAGRRLDHRARTGPSSAASSSWSRPPVVEHADATSGVCVMRPPVLIARAPFRVSFAGGGTDLAAYYRSFGGLVVSTAISRHIYVMLRPGRARSPVHLITVDGGTYTHVHVRDTAEPDGATHLPRAVLRYFGVTGGIELFIASEIPSGTGLGSSSALVVALIHAVSAYLGRSLRPADVAELACAIEIEHLGLPIGKQDQYASAIGGLNAITF